MSYFAFRFFEPDDLQRSSLAVFTESKVGLDTISRILKQDVSENLVPKHVYLINPQEHSYSLIECINNDSLVSEFESYLGDVNERLRCLSFDSKGELKFCDSTAVDKSLSSMIFQSGMLELFKKHRGLIESNTAYHFVKPSGDHCDKFIRASNLLVSSSEVTFLAISLLPYLKPNLKCIYVDTSSISFLISIAIRLYSNFDCGTPAIESFESYAALNHPYDFVEDSTSLIFISATTSGSLANNLLENTSLQKDQIVTLFHVNLPTHQEGIYDISRVVLNSLVSTKATQCEFCKQGSKPIRIAGDQFLPENPKHDPLVIKKTDFSSNREKFFRQFAAMRVLRWNQIGANSDKSKEHFYLDVKTSLENMAKDFSDNLERSAKRYISRDLKTVITLDDPGSIALKNAIDRYIGNSINLRFLSATDLNHTDLSDSGSVLVIAGAMTSGRSLLSISRKLRCISSLSSIVYFVGFSKLPSNEAKTQLEKDLKQGGHEVIILNNCPLPRIKEYSKTAWDWEREKLRPIGGDDPLGDNENSLPPLLDFRRQKIVNDELASDDLFLCNVHGEPLKLRRTFAFWSELAFDEERLKEVTQADVYWTVQCIIHDLRIKSEGGGLASAYHTTLISPANFDRYNDGIIQAALLRAAYPVELDYRLDPLFSRQMTDVCASVIRNCNNDQGEAALEFLMALWSGRMHLLDEHIKELSECFNDDMTADVKFLLRQLYP
jgi:hypothetical protein